jgi:hypothetical protein
MPRSLIKQRGAEVVEFALTLPVILVLFFIFVEFGIALSDQAVIANASRAAAREAIKGADDTTVYNAADAVLTSLSNWTGDDGCHACECCVLDEDGTPCCEIAPADDDTPPRSSADPGKEVRVKITFPFQGSLLSKFVSLPNLSAGTKMRMLPH